MRALFLGIVVSGCTFSGAAGVGDDTPGQTPDADPGGPSIDAAPGETDAQPVVAETCDAGDADVRLCLDFEEPNALRNKSPYSISISSQNVVFERSERGQAAVMSPVSQIVIGETPSLDVDEITTTMWIQPQALGTEQFLLDNHLQYATVYENDGDIRCMIGSAAVQSDTTVRPTDGWTHIACSYDRDRIRVFVNGSLEGCTEYDQAINKSPSQGGAVGGNKESGGVVTDELVGKIDLVRVYSRVLAPNEICTAAGRTSCKSSCPN